jgi:outer membrane protein, heavy metal efflux system
MRSVTVLSCIALFLSASGCGPSPLAESWPEARPLGRDLDTYRPPAKPPVEHPAHAQSVQTNLAEEPADELALRQALALALERNPALRGFAWEVRAAEARTLQASLLPNPELGAEVENIAGSGGFNGTDVAETTISLSQLIELGGKRSKRTRVATLGRDLAGWDYEAARIEVLTEVAQRYVQVLSSQRRLELAIDVEVLSQQFFDTVSKRVEAGAASPVEKTRASVVVSTSRIQLQRAQRRLWAARISLASTWGNPSPQFQAVSGELETIRDIPSIESLAGLISQNPDVARWAVEITRRRAQVALAKAQGTPDVTVGVGVRHFSETSDDAMVVGLSLPLPIFDRNQGGVLEARFNAAKAREQQRAAEVRVGAALGSVYQELAAAYDEAIMLKEEVLPAAQASYDATNQAYRQGKLGYLDVLDAQRSFIDMRIGYLEALSAYHAAVAEAEGLIGQSLNEIGRDAEPKAQQNPQHNNETPNEAGDQTP